MKLATATEFSLLILLAVFLSLFLARSCDAATKPAISIERVGTNVTVRFTVALRADGTLRAWGVNDRGQLGLGTTFLDTNTPQQVGTDTNWGPPP